MKQPVLYEDPDRLDLVWNLVEDYVAELRGTYARAMQPDRLARHDPRALQWPLPLQGSGWKRLEAWLFNFGAKGIYNALKQEGVKLPPMEQGDADFQVFLHCALDAHTEIIRKLLRPAHQGGDYAELRRGGFKRMKIYIVAIQGRALEDAGLQAAEAAQALGVAYPTYMRWRQQYAQYRERKAAG